MTDVKTTQKVDSASGQIGQVIDELVDGWCVARNKDALRLILPVWPVEPDWPDWASVLEALRAIRVQLHDGITADEMDTVNAALFFIEKFVPKEERGG